MTDEREQKMYRVTGPIGIAIGDALEIIGAEISAGVDLVIDRHYWNDPQYRENMMKDITDREHAGEYISRLDLLAINVLSTPEERYRYRVLRDQGILLNPGETLEEN